MSLKGAIVLIDDDADDRYMFGTMLDDGQQALEYLSTTLESPLLILCDINMPVMNGLELRDQIDADPYLKNKSIPFIFMSTSDRPSLIRQAYNGTVQGYFRKCDSFQEGKLQLEIMIQYWKLCLHPNNFK